MKSKFFKATPGWGTGDIDSVINEWLGGKNIEVIKLEYSTHKEIFRNVNGIEKEGVVYTATILYTDVV